MSKENGSKNMYGKGTGLEARFSIIGREVMRLDHIMSDNWRGEVWLTGLVLREPKEGGQEFLVVIKGLGADGGPLVAFHSALTPSEAIAGAVKRAAEGTLKWKVDSYASQRP